MQMFRKEKFSHTVSHPQPEGGGIPWEEVFHVAVFKINPGSMIISCHDSFSHASSKAQAFRRDFSPATRRQKTLEEEEFFAEELARWHLLKSRDLCSCLPHHVRFF